MVVEMLTRPYPLSLPVVVPMAVLVLLVPFYIVIGTFVTPGRTLHVPELTLDRTVPLQPIWSLVYGSHFLLVVLPFLIVRQEEQIRRTVLAYLMVWIIAYVCFLVYPTIAPRPVTVVGEGFFAWLVRLIYLSDPPYNCFPSLHVAHSFVSALTCYRVHRGVGIAIGLWVLLIAVSTMYIKQHYILDVVVGILLAYVAYLVFLRSYPREAIPELDRRLAPVLALGFFAIHGLTVACFWVAYRIRGVA